VAAARGGRGAGVAGLLRSPVLRLEQVEVTGAGDVEVVPARADRAVRLARQR
jgi:hypothetical protein